MDNQAVDILIAGGGLSGCLMALSIADKAHTDGKPLNIAIVEANPVLTDFSKTFDDRVLALSHGTASYLDKVLAWQYIESQAEAIETIHVSDRGHYGKARIKADDHQVNALGYVVEMAVIGQALLKALEAKTNITWFTENQINSLDWQTESVTATLADEQVITAKLLLACDGANSGCRQMANIGVTHSDYGQSALIANVAMKMPHHNVAYERFTETGPIAMLPLSSHQQHSNRCSLVWTIPPEQVDDVKSLNDNEFKQKLEQAFGSWLGEVTHVGKRDVYPLVLKQADEQVYHRMALIGNASHTIHPIAGQGFNLGVRDVALMADIIANALSSEQDIGSFKLLNQYSEQRIKDHNEVITLTDSLVTLFSNDLPPLVAGRNVGIKVLNYCSALKGALVTKTMGYS